MPQISQLAATYASQIFWLIVTFGLVFLVVGRGMLPRVQATIDGRDQRIAGDLTAAKVARDAAGQAESEWQARDHANRERAQGVVAEARAKASRATEATLGAANAEQAAQVAEREAGISEAAARAVAEIEGVAAEAAQAIVERVSGAQISADEARAANAEQAAQVAEREAGISEAAARAVAEIEGVAADAAQAIVERVSGAQISADEARAAVRQVMHLA